MVPPHYLESRQIRERTALVMPQWFSPEIDAEQVEQIVRLNLAGVDDYASPEHVCLVIDACPVAERAVAALNESRSAAGLCAYPTVVNDQNLGQGGSLVRGFAALIERGCPADWFVTRDADGDHFINDLPHLARMADQLDAIANDGCYMVVGRRVDVRRPMTWFRGELEELVNATLMDALSCRLARRGEVIDQRFMHPDVSGAGPGMARPDTQSGYKLYSLDLVRRVIDEYATLGEPPWGPDTFRYLGQVAPFWVCIDAGGVAGEVIRASLTCQSVSSFGPETFERQYRAKLHYILKRSELPVPAARQILANAIMRSGLWTHPDGRTLCRSLWTDLADELGFDADGGLIEPMCR